VTEINFEILERSDVIKKYLKLSTFDIINQSIQLKDKK